MAKTILLKDFQKNIFFDFALLLMKTAKNLAAKSTPFEIHIAKKLFSRGSCK
jgi:hypothetical protein